MSDTANSFGGSAYQSQQSRALSNIGEQPGPNIGDGQQQFVNMLQRHDYDIKDLAQNQQQLQVGVNQANANPIQQIQQFVADLQVLLGGGELPKGALQFGDLQYTLPAIGALFGFGTGGPVNLFQAAEKFFFGYVVPTQQYTDLQIAAINSWGEALGIDQQFIKDLTTMKQAFGDLFNGLQNLGPSLENLFNALQINGTDLGPLGQALSSILKWFQPIDFTKFGSMIEWLTDAIDPWVTRTTKTINFINALIAAIGAGGDVVNSPLPDVTRPFGNLFRLFATLDFSDPQFKTVQGWASLFSDIFVNLKEFDQGVWAALGGATSISIHALTDTQPNLLWNADFEGAISIATSDDWSWDSTVYYSADGLPGSAKVTADGYPHALQSNAINLAPGQSINLSVRVLADGLVTTGKPLRLDVVTFLNEVQVGIESVDFFGVPSAPPDNWVGAPATAKTISVDGVLHGVFTMPDDGTADSFVVQLGVDATASAGDVWFDDAVATLTGGLVANLISDFADRATAFTQAVNTVTTAARSYTDWPTFAAAFNAAVQTYVTTVSGIQADEVVTLKELMNSIVPGLFPSNSDTPTAILDLRTESDQANEATADLWNTLGTIMSTGGQTWSAALTQADAALKTYLSRIQQIDQSKAATLKQLFETFFHINIDTGEFDLSQVNGLTTSFNQLGAALSGDVDNAGDWAWLAKIMSTWFGISKTAHDTSVDNSNTLGQRNNQPLIYGLDDTTEANIVFASATTALPLKASNSIIAFVRCYQTDEKNTIAFTASKASGTSPSGLIVNLYKVDFTNNQLIYITSTTKTTAELNQASESWFFADAASTVVAPGDVLAVEFQSKDATNALNLWGVTTAKPDHPNAQLPAIAATRNAGTTAPTGNIPLNQLTFTNSNVPYVGIEISDPPAPVYPAFVTPYTTPTVVVTQVIEDWANFVDLVAFGGGGGGQGETGFVVGRGGSPAGSATKTLQRGVDFPTTGTTLTITIGDGGTGGGYFSNGGDGAATTISWTDIHGATQTLTAPGGQGGGLGNNNNVTSWGQAASDVTFNGQKYPGGTPQLTPGPGNPPGGSGPGGQPFQFGFKGGRGQAWTVERQS